jgi:multimeric flavodoxin WrbA
MKALFFNCSLKASPEPSNTDALIQQAVTEFEKLGVTSEVVRVVDYNVKPGVESDEGEGDEWPQLLEKIRACDIFIIGTPIWVGFTCSVTQRVIERLDAVFYDEKTQDPVTGQYLFYNKVGGVVVTGNEDGAHNVTARVLWALNEFGCTIPPNASAYWVGKAGPGPSYIEDKGQTYEYTNNLVLMMTHNLASMAKLLKENPIKTDLKQLEKRAKEMSDG